MKSLNIHQFIIDTGSMRSNASVVLKNGGTISVYDDNGKIVNILEFDATDINDLGNFLVSFLHRRGYPKPIITIDGELYHYKEPQQVKFGDVVMEAFLYPITDDKDILIPTTKSLADISDAFPEMTVDQLVSLEKRTYRFYSKNFAINQILNYNQVDPEVVKSRKLIKVIHERVLKGHTEIPKELEGKYLNFMGLLRNAKTESGMQIPVYKVTEIML